MASLVADVLKDAARISTDILGESCQYVGIPEPISIIINRNKEVFNDFGVLAGLKSQASLNKSDVKVKMHDTFTDSVGTKWRVNYIEKETVGKYYFDIIEV